MSNVTTTGWLGNIGNSIKGVLFGVVMVLIAFPLLWWNEGRAVDVYKGIAEGEGAVVASTPESVNPANEKKLVHMTGEATTEDSLSDNEFGMTATAIKLIRKVEMYQWKEEKHTETEKKAGGKKVTTTTYTHDLVWSSSPINSSNFEEPSGHENPKMPFQGNSKAAKKVTLGAYTLAGSQVAQMDKSEKLDVTETALELLPPEIRSRTQINDGGFYISAAEDGGTPGGPSVGDIRVTFAVVMPQTISILAQQLGDSFGPYVTKSGKPQNDVEPGTLSAEAMFEKQKSENAQLTWILRGVGFALMFFGVCLVFAPLVAVADVLPFVGNIVQMGTAIAAIAIALPLSFLTIGLAWVFYRPLLGIGLLAIAVIIFVGIFFLARSMMGKGQSDTTQPAIQ